MTRLHVNIDRELTNVTVREAGSDRTVTLETTAHHPFWDATERQWVDAGKLQVGHRLLVHDDKRLEGDGTGAGVGGGGPGPEVTVVAVDNFTGSEVMRDLTVATHHTYYVIAGDDPVLVHNCGGSRSRHDETCTCAQPGGRITGYHPAAGDTVVLGKAEVGVPLAAKINGVHFNGKPYGNIEENGNPQWVNEVQNALGNDSINIAVDLGGLRSEAGWGPREIFRAAAERGSGPGGWRGNAGTDWEMRQILIKSFRNPNLAGRISWHLNGTNVTSQMQGLLD